jgi:hypothetical protein
VPAEEVDAEVPSKEADAEGPAEEVDADGPAEEADADEPAEEADADEPVKEADAEGPAEEVVAGMEPGIESPMKCFWKPHPPASMQCLRQRCLAQPGAIRRTVQCSAAHTFTPGLGRCTGMGKTAGKTAADWESVGD